MAGLPPAPAMQGRSLLPLFNGNAPGWRESFLVEYYSDTVFPRIKTMGYSAVRTGRHKYIQFRELKGMDELYDLEADPYELRNLAARSESAALLEQLQAELQRIVASAR
jgi:N-acetylglucosamine-6-sulfatase